MSYIKRHLGYGERLIHYSRITAFVFVPWIVLCAAFGAAAMMFRANTALFWALAATAALCLIVMVRRLMFYLTSEFAITNRRVLGKVGLTEIQTVDIMLAKVESVRIDQDFTGQIFNYGNVEVTGTGGTGEILTLISNPARFRGKLEQALG